MKLLCCALYDSAVETFHRPILVTRVEEAVRALRLMLERGDSSQEVVASPGDFTLYNVGEYDTQSGVMSPPQGGSPVRIVSVLEISQLIKKESL